jgi:hypothetical protein
MTSLVNPLRKRDLNNMYDQLIENGTFYFHNALRNLPAPPFSYEGDNGELVTEQPNLEIEIKKSFTTKDLLDYYKDAFEIKLIHPDDVKQFTNALRYMVKRYGLDETLFTIDYYRDLIFSENVMPPNVPFDIQRYFPYGKETLENKKAREVETGIVRRQEGDTYAGNG